MSPHLRRYLVILALSLVLVACQFLRVTPHVPATRTPAGEQPTLDVTATPVLTPAPASAWLRAFPQPAISGDRLTFDVRFPDGEPLPLTVTLTLPTQLLTATPAPWALDGAPGVRWIWAWDTTGFQGRVPVTLTLTWADAAEQTQVAWVDLAPPEARSPYEAQARWTVAEAPGLRFYYLTGSAAARDIELIRAEAVAAYAAVTATLGVEPTEPVSIYLLDRVYGQGGYASSQWVAITYTDRDYAPARLDLVLRHELVHRLDDALGCTDALTLVREGLAVHLSGGHYRPEPPAYHLSTLRAEGLYIPLERLVRNFYTHQHEIGYLEAASLVSFVEARHGRDGLRTLCTASIAQDGGEDELTRLQRALAALGYAEVDAFERAWGAWAAAEPASAQAAQALRTLTSLVDTMRAYQEAYDPVAYYLTGVLFDPAWAEQNAIPPADFVRASQTAEAVTLELLLTQAMRAFASGHLQRAEALLGPVQDVLRRGSFSDGLALDVYHITQTCLRQGYTPYAVTYTPAQTVVLATVWDGVPRRVVLSARPGPKGWQLALLAWLD